MTLKKSFKLATVFNIPIEVNYSWFIILGLIIFTLGSGYFPYINPGLDSSIYWLLASISALLLFASLLAHELSHAIVARRNNIPIHGITLFVFGGVAQMDAEPSSPIIEFKMAIAGPIMSFTLALLFFALSQLLFTLGTSGPIISLLYYLFMINIVVGVFNMIPGFPLDGGRVLRALLWHVFKDIKKATAIASNLGKLFAFILMAFGIFNIISGALVSGIWLIFVGLFLQEAAEVSYRQIIMKKMLAGVGIKSLMTRDVITVPTTINLDELVNSYFFKYRHASFPVMEDDLILGLVTFHDLKEIPRQEWPTRNVKEIMLPLSELLVINQNADAMDALAKMAQNGIGRLLVIENTKLIGIISQKDIMQLFKFRAAVEKD